MITDLPFLHAATFFKNVMRYKLRRERLLQAARTIFSIRLLISTFDRNLRLNFYRIFYTMLV